MGSEMNARNIRDISIRNAVRSTSYAYLQVYRDNKLSNRQDLMLDDDYQIGAYC